MAHLDFTHASYLALLSHLRSLGLAIGPFRDVLDEPRFVILRHDIDFSLERAAEMARLDAQAGVRATFFVLLTSPYYNVLSERGAALLREIAGMGHELGLHVDLTGFDLLDQQQQQERIARLGAVLGNIVGCEIRCIAQHRPASTLVRVHSPGFTDAYDDRYYRHIGYISDSRRCFAMPDVHGFFAEHPRSQFLVHPLWWTPEPMTRSAIFEQLAAELSTGLRDALRAEDARIEARLQALAQAT